MSSSTLGTLIEVALAEDVGAGDWTTLWTVPQELRATARIVAKSPGVIAGTACAAAVFHRVDPKLEIEVLRDDGTSVAPGEVALRIRGRARGILTGERTALNFLQRLSGIATLTRRFVDATSGTRARILDTRKTTPGWRELEKAAVRAGGGENHRAGLHDMVLIKENHIEAAGGIAAALKRVQTSNQANLPVEVEVRDLSGLEEAIANGAHRVLLDNMSTPEIARAVLRAASIADAAGAPRPRLEASGNMSIDRIPEVARTGVDDISVGALTHSATALDLSLLLDLET